MYASFDFVRKIVPGTSTSFVVPPPPEFPMAGSSADLWFITSQYDVGGTVAITDELTCTRASIGYATTTTGTLTQFADNVLRITNLGLLVEPLRTNVVLWNRDLTNVAWTPTNITALLDQTGPDGSTNSASSLEATAGNGTILQSITLASSDRFQSAYVKRLVGTGTINMTMDNGATWTAITVTSNWTLVSIPTQTLANPVVGFRIVTSGDKIAVDFVQNENGLYGTSPIPTTTTSAARAADVIKFAGGADALLVASAATAYADVILLVSALSPSRSVYVIYEGNFGKSMFRTVGNDTQVTCDTIGGTTNSNFASGDWLTGAKVANAFNTATGTSVVGNAGTAGTLATTWSPSSGGINLGSDGSNFLEGYIRRIVIWNSRLSDATLQTLTTP